MHLGNWRTNIPRLWFLIRRENRIWRVPKPDTITIHWFWAIQHKINRELISNPKNQYSIEVINSKKGNRTKKTEQIDEFK